MYLSKLTLEPRSKRARFDLSSAYEMHRSLCRAVAHPDEAVPRFLWRLESSAKTPIVLMQSLVEPHWQQLSNLDEFGDYFAELPTAKPLPLEHLQPSQTLRFRLKCNPTITTLANDGSAKKKRYGLYKLEDLVGEEKDGVWKPGWLERQSSKSGFELMGFMVAQSEKINIYKHDRATRITLQSVLYEGHLKITDLGIFKQTLATGLGHAKALGFGLLSIAKAK